VILLIGSSQQTHLETKRTEEVMEPTFNLIGLKKIYNESLRKNEQTLVFEIKHGKGLFNFLMFFSDDDIESKDKLYLLLSVLI
jgi:hypothetical protein